MQFKKHMKGLIAGFCAGTVTGLFGTGGGMILVPLLRFDKEIPEEKVFGSSVAIILPLCVVSLVSSAFSQPIPWASAFPYMAGSLLGGIGAGIWGNRIPTSWLHRLLGVLILWGGLRYLW